MISSHVISYLRHWMTMLTSWQLHLTGTILLTISFQHFSEKLAEKELKIQLLLNPVLSKFSDYRPICFFVYENTCYFMKLWSRSSGQIVQSLIFLIVEYTMAGPSAVESSKDISYFDQHGLDHLLLWIVIKTLCSLKIE